MYELMKPKLDNSPTRVEKLAFVSRMRDIARRVQSSGGIDSYSGARIPPGIKADFGIAQLAIESAYGTSELARNAFNLSGLTADPDSGTYWVSRGLPTYSVLTTERRADQSEYKLTRYFRRYNSWEESYIDWARLLWAMYPEAFAATQLGNFKDFADGLQNRGYARNDKRYSEKLQRAYSEIERLS